MNISYKFVKNVTFSLAGFSTDYTCFLLIFKRILILYNYINGCFSRRVLRLWILFNCHFIFITSGKRGTQAQQKLAQNAPQKLVVDFNPQQARNVPAPKKTPEKYIIPLEKAKILLLSFLKLHN